MVEIIDKYTAHDLTNILLDKYNILIKDLSKKVGVRFVRIAIRNNDDNDRLIKALREL